MTRSVLVLAVAAGLAAAPAAVAQGGGQAGADSARARQGTDTTVTLPRRSLQREVYSYSSGGRRDPMVSLLNTADLRPLLSEVEIISIIFDHSGTNHVALLRNRADQKVQYRVRIGDMLGRNRVTQITRHEVLFTIEEFGFSRQERLSIKPDTTAARTQ